MRRHFILAMTIAAAAHAALLAIPRGAVPKPLPEPPRTILVRPPVVPPEEPVTVDELPKPANAGPRHSVELPRAPDAATATLRDPFVVPVEKLLPYTPAVTPNAIPADGLGRPDGTGRSGFGAIAASHLDNTPRTRVAVAPIYPAAARHDGREATVTVEFIVDESGIVLEPRVVGSADALFDRAALDAIARWKFEPGTANGRRVKFRMAVPIVFRLSEA